MANRAKQKILLVEEPPSSAAAHASQLREAGFSVDLANSYSQASGFARTQDYCAALVDLGLRGEGGLSLIKDLRAAASQPIVLIIADNASVQLAVRAVRLGCHDYLMKPIAHEKLIPTLENALKANNKLFANARPKQPVCEAVERKPTRGDADCGFTGKSKAIQQISALVATAAPSQAPVFITGESGTGKELCSMAIHRNSACSSGPFIALNCGAIPHELMESEIFGHVKGAFTGASSDRTGAARAADKGTLFLDEICEMDVALQTKLLRFLQTGQVQPVGTTETIKVNVRIVCATNKDPAEQVRLGHFREDLYFRLFVLPIELPPLRQRREDIGELIEVFLHEFAAEEGTAAKKLSPAALAKLDAYSWPGNIRELQNVIRRAVVMNPGDVIEAEMLPAAICNGADGPKHTDALQLDITGLHEPIKQLRSAEPVLTLSQIERQAIETTISACGGSIPKAAQMLGVSPSTLYRKREVWQQ